MARAGLAYWLSKSMYISLTDRACGLALAASRGPSFVMPAASGFVPLNHPEVSNLGIRTCSTHDLVDGTATCGTLARLGGRTHRAR